MWNYSSTIRNIEIDPGAVKDGARVAGRTGGRMFRNTMPRYEILSPDAMQTLDRGWRRIVSEIGVEFILPEAVEIFRAAGCKTEDATVWLDPDFVMEQVAKAPREFDLVARNPERSVRIGGDNMVFTGVYGPPFVRAG